MNSMFSDYNKLNNVCGAIQSITVSLAIAIGSIWTMCTFNSQFQVANAKAELKKLRRENLAIAINSKISTSQLENFGDENRHILVEIKLENNGFNDLLVKLKNVPIKASKISFLEDGSQVSGSVIKAKYKRISSDGKLELSDDRRLNVKETDIYPFLLKVSAPGIYLIDFDVPIVIKSYDKRDASHKKKIIQYPVQTFAVVK